MKDLMLVKVAGGFMVFHDQDLERIKHIANGTMVIGDIRQSRNYKYLQRFICMVRYTYDLWNPKPTEYKGIPVHKDYETFREDVTVAAGYAEMSLKTNGEIAVRAKSISFAKMDEETFRKLYNAVFNTCWNLVLKHVPGMTETEAHNAINSMLSFE